MAALSTSFSQPQYPPGSRVHTSNPRETVAILRSERGLEAAEPITVPDMFLATTTRFPDRAALRFKAKDDAREWREISYADYYRSSFQAAKSFAKLGIDSLSPVALMGFLSPECLFVYFGAILAGGVFIGVCPGMTPDGLLHLLNLSKAQFIFVEKSEQVEWILKIRDKLTTLKAIVQYKGKLIHRCSGLYSWDDFVKFGENIEDSVIKERVKKQNPSDCVTMAFSSGTTGDFKCAMMSHDNLTWTTKMLYSALSYGLGFGVDDFVSVSALFAISCLNLDVYLAVYSAATLHIAPISARCVSMRDYLPTLRQVLPTLFFGNPNNWDDVRSILVEEGATTAKSARDFLGLQKCRILLTAGATVPVELLEYFKTLGMPLVEAYGMTENSGGITVNPLEEAKIGSVGKPYPGTYLRIDQPDEHGTGEILVFGRQRFMGYMHDEEETRKVIDERGWLHTGDAGHIDSDGFLFITGRIKEIIVLSEGHNVAPVPIEARIKQEVPFLSNVVLVGDGQDHLCCLVTLKTQSDPQTGEPLDRLTPAATAHIAQLGSRCDSASVIVRKKDEAVYQAIQRGIDAANSCVFDNMDQVLKFTVLDKDFSIAGGEIGDTSKLKRHVIKRKYSKQISDMYQ